MTNQNSISETNANERKRLSRANLTWVENIVLDILQAAFNRTALLPVDVIRLLLQSSDELVRQGLWAGPKVTRGLPARPRAQQ